MEFFYCSKAFWPELSEFQEKKFKRIDSKKLSISKEFQLLATNIKFIQRFCNEGE